MREMKLAKYIMNNLFFLNAWVRQQYLNHLSTFLHFTLFVNSSPPSAAYIRQWTGSALVQVMACRLFGAKPLPEPMLVYCQLDSWEQISVKFESEFYHFRSRKCIWNCRLSKWRPFCLGGDELNIAMDGASTFKALFIHCRRLLSSNYRAVIEMVSMWQ